jgi:hypothetical protein
VLSGESPLDSDGRFRFKNLNKAMLGIVSINSGENKVLMNPDIS